MEARPIIIPQPPPTFSVQLTPHWCSSINFSHKNKPSTMDVHGSLKFYAKLFYVVGQSPAINTNNCLFSSKKSGFLWEVPTLAFIVISMVLLASAIILQNLFRDSYGEPNGLITNLTIFSECSANFIFYIQCIRNHGNLNEVWRYPKDIYHLVKGNYKCQINVDLIKTRIFRKMFLIFISYLIEICFYVAWCFVADNWYIRIHLKAFKFTSVMACMHAIMYTELLHFYLEHLNATIVKDLETNEPLDNVVYIKAHQFESTFDKMRTMKNIHFRLWKIGQEINLYFGWGLVAIITRNFLNATYDIYWMLLLVNGEVNAQQETLLKYCRNEILVLNWFDWNRFRADLSYYYVFYCRTVLCACQHHPQHRHSHQFVPLLFDSGEYRL